MRPYAVQHPMISSLAVVLVMILASPGSVAGPRSPRPAPSAADAIAEKFAREAAAAEARRKEEARAAAARAARKRREEERHRHAEMLKQDEAEMLARARKEAEERWLAEAQAERRREEAREAERLRAQQEAIARAEAEKAKLATLARTRHDQDDGRARIGSDVDSRRASDRSAVASLEAQARQLADDLEAVARRHIPGGSQNPYRQAELDRNDPAATAKDELSADNDPAFMSQDDKAPSWQSFGRRDDGDNDQRVTVLLVMEAHQPRGLRRFPRRLNPILCTLEGCYVSQGPDRPADLRSRRSVLGLGARAGDCRGDSMCIFRDVDLSRVGALFQPVSLRVLRHDRREPQLLRPDWSCRLERRALTCDAPIVSLDYRLWVVPEAIARRVGPTLLEEAVSRGLVNPFSASISRVDAR